MDVDEDAAPRAGDEAASRRRVASARNSPDGTSDARPEGMTQPELASPAVAAAKVPTTSLRTKRPGRRSRVRLLALLIAGVVAVVSAGVLVKVFVSGRRAGPQLHYETAELGQGAVHAKVTATGTMSALVTVQVGSQVSGRIESLFADYNSPVKKGEKVATIDDAFFKAAVANARGALASAGADVERAKTKVALADAQAVRARALAAEGLLSKADLEVAEANALTAKADVRASLAGVSRAQAELDQALLNLQYTTIVSPIDGVVISRNVDVGQTVAASLQAPTLFTIAHDLSQMQIDTSVAESDVGKIKPGMRVTFTVDAYPGRAFEGKVRQVRNAPQTIQNVVTYDAVVDVENPDQLLKPGMTASVTFTYAEKADVLFVPNAALRFRPDTKTLAAMQKNGGGPKHRELAPDQREIWVMRGDKPAPVVVSIGISDGNVTEVKGGEVGAGDRAITEAMPL